MTNWRHICDGFYSDPHFGHTQIIKYCDRPFNDAEDMTEILIEQYNKSITKKMTVLWCGDAFFCNVEKAKTIMDRLNGRKIIVVGNHDRGMGSLAGTGFDLVADELVTQIAERTIRIKHYPYAGNLMSSGKLEQRYLDLRPIRIKGEILIHGHSHGKKAFHDDCQIDVGVDAWGYKPAMMDEIVEIVKTIK